MSKQKVKKPYTIKSFTEGFILESIIILYVILLIGNMFISEFDTIFVRYIPVGIVGFLITYSIIKSSAKKLKKADKESLKKMSFIFPIVIAVIMLLYGLYSVNSNFESVRARYSMLAKLMEESSTYEETFEDVIAKARDEANLHWFITSVVYLAFAEIGAFLGTRKLDGLLQEDEIELTQEENVDEGQLLVEGDEKLDLTPTNNTVSEPQVNNAIKWDL